jgi:hypothetical protein
VGGRPNTRFILGAMLLTDAIAGVVFAIVLGPAFGAIVFAVAAATSVLAIRMIGARSGSGGATPPPPSGEPTVGAGEDPSYNPYARED